MQAAAALHDRLGRHLTVWRVGNLYALVGPGKLALVFSGCALRSFGCSGFDWVVLGVIFLVGADVVVENGRLKEAAVCETGLSTAGRVQNALQALRVIELKDMVN